MATIYLSVRGSQGGGGPSIFCYKFANAIARKGHRVIYDKPQKSDIALAIINTGSILRKVKKAKSKTKVMLRIDGIYNKLYNEKFNRAIRPDMTALHDELKRDIPLVHHTFYQSQWSKDRIFDEIVRVDRNNSVINNGVDINLFKPIPQNRKEINLIHVAKMRDEYLMEMLVGTYKEVKSRGHNVNLLLVGTMDGGCQRVLKRSIADPNIKHLGNFPNGQLTRAYSMGDIFLDVRQGSSCNNVVPEAQACGIPVITPSWGGSCEMVLDGKTGVIAEGGKWDYDQKYIQNLSNAVEKIIPDLNGYKLRARKHAVQSLNLDIMIKKYMKAMGL